MNKNKQNISWYLNLSINDIKTIFQEQTLPYEVDCYSCSCGKDEIILKNKSLDLDSYECSECGNTDFYNANKYTKNDLWYKNINEIFSEDILLELNPNIKYHEINKLIKADISVNIPVSLDLARNEIIYKKRDIYTITIDEVGELEENLLSNFDLDSMRTDDEIRFFTDIKEQVLINRNPIINNFKIKILDSLKSLNNLSSIKVLQKVKSLDEFTFFIKFSHLLNIDFYKWNNVEYLPKDKDLSQNDAFDFILNYRKERTLKKAILLNYRKQIRTKNTYDFFYIHSILKHIKDINIALRMIELDLSEYVDELKDISSLDIFIEFLSTTFTDIEIERIFNGFLSNYIFWLKDTLHSFNEIEDSINELPKIKANYKNIHDEIYTLHNKISNKEMFKQKFIYENTFNEACVQVGDYKATLPLIGLELYEWSKDLSDCMFTYASEIKQRETTIYGFLLNDKIKFAVEIKNNKIVQLSKRFNDPLEEKDKTFVKEWFVRFFGDKITADKERIREHYEARMGFLN